MNCTKVLSRMLLGAVVLQLSSINLLLADDIAEGGVSRDTISYHSILYFSLDRADIVACPEVVKAHDMLQWSHEHPLSQIRIEGWTDDVGSREHNAKLSWRRAKQLRDYLVDGGVDSLRIDYVGRGVDYLGDSIVGRRAEFTACYSVEREAQRVIDSVAVCGVVTPQCAIVEEVEEIECVDIAEAEVEVVDCSPLWRGVTLRTNLLYWLCGVMNIGVEWRGVVEDRVSILLNGGYSPMSAESWRCQWGIRYISPEIRYYIGRDMAWFVGGELLYGYYNVKLSGHGDRGHYIGGGAVGGYRITLKKGFEMDFTAALGAGNKWSVVPLQLGINLIWNPRE